MADKPPLGSCNCGFNIIEITLTIIEMLTKATPNVIWYLSKKKEK